MEPARLERSSLYRTWKRVVGGAPGGPVEDAVALEEPLEIRVAGRGVGVTMRSPGGAEEDRELAIGFLLGEGVIRGAGDVERVRRCGKGDDGAAGDVVDVLVSSGVAVDFARLTRHVFASSSCGVCGSATIEAVMDRLGPGRGGRLEGGPVVEGARLLEMVSLLRGAQRGFDVTGGLHGAGVFGVEEGGAVRLLAVREDVGRHNAVDKVVGWAVLRGMTPLSGHALVVSGRVSFEIVQKAVSAGVRVVAAVSAPSSLAIDLAEAAGVTLVGFLREGAGGAGGRFNAYAHPWRVV